MPSESEKSDDADEVTVTMYGVTSVIKNRRYQAMHVDVDWSQFDQLSLIKDIDFKERRRRKRERVHDRVGVPCVSAVVAPPAAASAEGDIIMEEADQSRRVPTQQEEQQSRRVPTTAGQEDNEIEVMESRRAPTAMEVDQEIPRDSVSGSQSLTIDYDIFSWGR